MTEHESRLLALEAGPDDASRWHAYADWLEGRDPNLAHELRRMFVEGFLERHRDALFHQLDRKRQRLAACDCIGRVLPLFERDYPDDRRPRELVETMKRYATGKRVEAAREAVLGSRRVVEADSSRDPYRFNVADVMLANIHGLRKIPWLVCHNAARLIADDHFGSRIDKSNPGPEWRALRDAEVRWQIARLLRYRFGFLGGPDQV